MPKKPRPIGIKTIRQGDTAKTPRGVWVLCRYCEMPLTSEEWCVARLTGKAGAAKKGPRAKMGYVEVRYASPRGPICSDCRDGLRHMGPTWEMDAHI